MKAFCVALLFTLLGLCATVAAEDAAPKISVNDLNPSLVIGQIGVPLGQVTPIEAVVVSGDALGDKASAGSYFLSVRAVGGVALKKEVLMPFYEQTFGKYELPNDHFELHKFKTGRDAKSLSSDQVRELEKGFVGARLNLLAYETGGFTGIPRGLPRDFPVWQDTLFHFRSSLVIVGESK